MINLNELEQFVSFAEYKTLARVAQHFHISTPSITRTMQHVEESFGVPLFIRKKNHIELNETGKLAVEQAKKILQETRQSIQIVQEFDKRQHTLVIRSCAPAPLWKLLHTLSIQSPSVRIESAICDNEEVISSWKNQTCDIAILPFKVEGAKEWMKENLYVCVPKNHELSKYKSLSFEQINGFNFLLRTQLGFWDKMVREKMNASKFLVQSDEFTFHELVKSSSLPCFTTDYTLRNGMPFSNRVCIPISDSEAQITFYILKKEKNL